ncbi:MAG: LysR family transcriptional regulator, partial [Fusobacteriaceae bacterium]|nr:LysR family transcriptional regulator [Fusobacteriaceae bacterium]
MTFRHLNIFLEVCREKSMTKAAKNLYMTQPSVTQAIKELEQYYEVKLFDRIGKKIIINNEGYKLLTISENIIRLFNESKNQINRQEINEIFIGTSMTVGTYFINKINDILKKNGNIKPKFIVDNTNNIEEQILSFKIDIGIVEGKIHSPNIISTFIMADELGLVCSPENKNFKNKVEIIDLENSKFIFREKGSGTRELIEAIFLQNNIRVQEIARV